MFTFLSNARPRRQHQLLSKTTDAGWQGGGKASKLQQLLMWLRIQLQQRYAKQNSYLQVTL